jgi:hypothetical protein
MRGEEPLVVLRVVDDGPALPAVVPHDVDDIGSRSPLRDTFNLVVGKLLLQGLEQIDLGSFAKLRSRLILVLALQIIEIAG